MYRYRSDLYWYRLAKNNHNPSCTGTALTCAGIALTCTGTDWPKMTRTKIVLVQVPQKCLEMVYFTIFHGLLLHTSLIFHSSSKINMKSIQTTPQILLISQIIQGFIPKFTQFYQTSEFLKDSIFNYDQLGIFNQASLNSRVRVCSQQLEKGTNLIFKENPSTHTQVICIQKSYNSLLESIQKSSIHTLA